MGFRPYRLCHSILVPMLLVVDLIFSFAYLSLLESCGLMPTASSEAEASAEGAVPVLLLEVEASVVAAPLCEELFFKGILFTGFRRYYGP